MKVGDMVKHVPEMEEMIHWMYADSSLSRDFQIGIVMVIDEKPDCTALGVYANGGLNWYDSRELKRIT